MNRAGVPWHRGLVAIPALLVFWLVFGRDLALPGLYMDTINPEYLAVRALNPAAIANVPAWVLPGNLLFERFPVLAGSYYHGALQYYLALPAYALLGTDIISARLVQGLYGSLVLAALALVAVRFRLRPWIAASALVLLALDPSFNIGFRTQIYNVVLPLALMLPAIALAARWGDDGTPPPRWQLLLCGMLAGLAFFCYFVYLMFLPALLAWLLLRLRAAGASARAQWAAMAIAGAGFCLGASPYLLGFALMAQASGGGALAGHAGAMQKLAGGGFELGLVGQLRQQANLLFNVIGDTWVSRMMLRQDGTSTLGSTRAALLLCAPLLLHAWLRIRGRRAPLLSLCLLLGASLILCTLPFGGRIGGQHYALLLPLIYLGAAAGVSALLVPPPPSIPHRGLHRPATAIVAACVAVLLLDAVTTHARFSASLRASGGAAMFSDAINRFAADARADGGDAAYYFPEWGLAMPFVFLTGGERRVLNHTPDADSIRGSGCAGVWIVHWQRRDALRHAHALLESAPDLDARLHAWHGLDGEPALHATRFTPAAAGCTRERAMDVARDPLDQRASALHGPD